MTVFILLCAIIGGALGYVYLTKLRSNSISPAMGAGIGAVGGVIIGSIIRAIFSSVTGLIGLAVLAAIAFYAYKSYGKR